MIMGAPAAVGTALFLSHHASEWVKKPMVLLVDAMAANPTTLFGL